MKGDKPMTNQTSLRNLLQKPCLLVGTPRARKEGGEGEEEKRRRERRRCSQLRRKRPGTHQKGRAPSYDESIQGHPRKKEGEERKERERERALRAPVRDTPVRERGVPEYYIQEHPKREGRREG